MSRLSLTDWYRYLETQYADDEPDPQPSEPVAETPAYDSPAASPSSSEPPSPAVPKEQTPTVAAAQTSAAPAPAESRRDALVSIRVPDFTEFVPIIVQELGLREPETPNPPELAAASTELPAEGPRLRKRKRRSKKPSPEAIVPPEADELWAKLPRYLRYLAEWTDDDGVTRKYYPVRGRDESREELIARLTDPVLTLEETARLLGVCPATVRRYTDRGWLRCFRTEGNQRRFRLSDIVAFLEEQALRQPRGNRNAHRESETP
jgi:excisionase family DNA binding protein